MKRNVLKILSLFLIAALFLSGCSTGSNASPLSSPSTGSNTSGVVPSQVLGNKFGKVLVVYYSLTGHTSQIGSIIKDMTGGDVFEIQPDEDYNRPDIQEIGKKQVSEGYKPKLKNSISNIRVYDTIFIGSPVWWGSVSPPVMSFLSQYDFKDKKVVPFCTYGGNRGDFFNIFEKACPSAKILKGADFTNNESINTDKVKEKINLWLNEISKE